MFFGEAWVDLREFFFQKNHHAKDAAKPSKNDAKPMQTPISLSICDETQDSNRSISFSCKVLISEKISFFFLQIVLCILLLFSFVNFLFFLVKVHYANKSQNHANIMQTYANTMQIRCKRLKLRLFKAKMLLMLIF